MGESLAYKILKEHLVDGELKAGTEIAVRIDQTLTQDATGTMAYLEFEAMNAPLKTELSVSYVDHNMLQNDYMNADDHRFLQSIAAKYGLYFSRPGNGICHQVHLERFSLPGKTLLGSDSHTPTCGGMGMIAIGAGGLDVAMAMAGKPFYLPCPSVTLVKLIGRLRPWVSAKDVILEVLRRLTVKGGVGKIVEYGGEGVRSLSVPERATITNMGAELGATTSIFPSDKNTRNYMALQKRKGWRELAADEDARYDEAIEIDLSKLDPLIAQPHSPDNVVPVKEIEGAPVHQVCVGSCTNSSYDDLSIVAKALRGKKIHPDVSMTLTPGSKQVFEMISKSGALADIISAGARLLESACGPCIGMGQAPNTDAVSVRTFNRNFEGRSGTPSAKVYLASPETAVACALRGKITDPRRLGKRMIVSAPRSFAFNDNMIVKPLTKAQSAKVQIVRGPNIKPFPRKSALDASLGGEILLKTGDNITTDHILPAGSKILPLRSNIPAISEFVFERVDKEFVKRAKEKGGGFVIGGGNYGQGSSREHAALAPMYLGVKAVIAKSFARIHRGNLINFGIIPMTFANNEDYDKLELGDILAIENVADQIRGNTVTISNRAKGYTFKANINISDRERKILVAGGALNM